MGDESGSLVSNDEVVVDRVHLRLQLGLQGLYLPVLVHEEDGKECEQQYGNDR